MLFEVAVLAAALLLAHSLYTHLARPPLPPGPPRSIWGGNEHTLPWVQPWKVYADWSKTFGPLIYIYAYGRDILIVNGAKAAEELLDRRASLYARRPTWSMVALTGRHNNIAFMDNTERQRKSRAVMQAALNPKSQKSWGPILEDESETLMYEILKAPEGYKLHIKKYLASFITRFTYGIEVDDEYMRLADVLSQHTQQALRPGRWIVDSIPALIYLPSWLPGMGFKRWTQEARQMFVKFTSEPYAKARASVLNGSANPGMVPDLLHEILNGKSKFDEDALISAASSIFTAATDTTTAVLSNFLLLLTTHPDAQQKAYEEIISVVGTSRLPSLADQPNLPYLAAMMREVHRFNPVTPVIPRSPVKEDVYEGLRIPENTWTMFNIWAMTHDPEIYPDPDVFRPERHLNVDEKNYKDPRDFAFGFGKRLCPGMNLANAQIYLFMAQIIALFEVVPPLDENGVEKMPPLEYTSTFVCFPKPFVCRFVPRKTDIANQMLLSI